MPALSHRTDLGNTLKYKTLTNIKATRNKDKTGRLFIAKSQL